MGTLDVDPVLLEPHVSTRLLRGLIKHFEEQGLSETIDAIFGDCGLPREMIEAQDGWVSVVWIGRFLHAAAKRLYDLDELPPFEHPLWQHWRTAGQRSVSRSRLGALHDMARALGSPRLVYKNLPTMGELANRTIVLEIDRKGPGQITARMRMKEARFPLWPPLAWNTIGLLEAVPGIWGLPLAHVRVLHSPFDPVAPTDELVLEVRYEERQPLLIAVAIALVGLAGAMLVGLVAAPLAGSTAGSLGAWAGGATALGILALRELRRTSATQEAESVRLGALIREADQRYASLWEERMRLQESLLHSQKLSQYLSPELVRQIAEDPSRQTTLGGARTEAAVLFIDLVGFTPRTERRDPVEVLEELNLYFSFIDPAFARHDGIIDKRMGDGVMAVFIARPGEQRGGVIRRALRCGVDLQRGVEACNVALRARGAEELRARVGVAVGGLVQGTMGSPARFEYTVIGDVVNTAARLEGQARAGQIAVQASVFDEISLESLPEATLVDRRHVAVKGKAEPVDVAFLAPAPVAA